MGAMGGGGNDPPPKPDGPAVQEASSINLIENERNMNLLPTPVIDDPPMPMYPPGAAMAPGCFAPGGGAVSSMLMQGMPTGCCGNMPDFLSRIHQRAG